jgi:hypothetical protein
MTESSVDFEIKSLEEANFCQYIPLYLIDSFKDDYNENILQNLIKNLDHLIQSIQANNSFKILTLSDTNSNEDCYNKTDYSINSSLSDSTLNTCKSLLIETSNRILEIFTKYHDEIYANIHRFEFYIKKFNQYFEDNLNTARFRTKEDLLLFQRAILVERLSSKHYNLLNIVYRNVFDFYQKINLSEDDQDEELQEEDESEHQIESKSRINRDFLIERFHKINKIL